MPYMLYLPDDFDADGTEQYPLIINLHGQGEKGKPDGSDNGDQLDPATSRWTSSANQNYQRSMVLAPQVVTDGPGTGNWTNYRELYTFEDLLDYVVANYPVNEDRVYISGISMGGNGAWFYGGQFRDRVAAIAPGVGYGSPKESYPLKDMPIWTITADNDSISFKGTLSYVNLTTQYGAKPILTQYATGGHGVSGSGFATPGFYEWMMAQRRNQPAMELQHPFVRIESPTTDDSLFTNDATISLSGTLGDETTAVTVVRWTRYGPDGEEARGDATGVTPWSVDDIPLVQGDNLIVIEAEGTSYSSSKGGMTKFRDNIHVRYMPVGAETEYPTVSIVSPDAGPDRYEVTTDKISVGGTASDNVGVTQIRWANNRGPISGTASGTDNWIVPDIQLEFGLNVIQITAIDAANNRTTVEFDVWYDNLSDSGSGSGNQPPVITLQDDFTLSLPVNRTAISGEVSDDGLPDGAGISTVWSMVSGPAPVHFDDVYQVDTFADFSAAGVYILRLSADDSEESSTADLIVTVSDTPIGAANTLFYQDFGTSSVYTDYISDDPTQFFNDISAETNGGVWSIDSGVLINVRSGVTSSDDDAGVTILRTMPEGTELVKVSFDMGIMNASSSSDLFYIEMGDYGSIIDYGTAGSHSVHAARLNVRGGGANKFSVRVNGSNVGDYPATGELLNWTWYVNRSSAEASYTGPDGGVYVLSAGATSIWIGDAIIHGNLTMETGFTAALRDFRIRLNSGVGITVKLDNLKIEDALNSSPPDYFGGWVDAEGLSGSDAVANADPDGDSLPNILEFVLNLDPGDPRNESERMPEQTIVQMGGQRFLQLVFDRLEAIGAVSVIIEVSDDLNTWYSGPEYTLLAAPAANGDGTVRMQVMDRTPLSGDDCRFMRVRVAE
ncbi:alpha/beta hydrolase-fold protein [Cerasicoccus fimbriatus]|uniref:carboxylesterase family protein n=1 Tax=Cerasicoccus fimbriatus TaxID=3014554 RepID=UPI0022B3D67D|nr:alpha/beta hydrolase-fold protein [Cerasicoccus sp. TK19100]